MLSSPKSRTAQRRRLGRIATCIIAFAFTLICLTQALHVFLSLKNSDEVDIHTLLRSWGLPPSIYYHTVYPTSFTRDVQPKPIHSHNDYWRRVPFYSALRAGAVSVEADVWEYDGELFVGHDTASLTRNRTFQHLYVQPLLEVLEAMNPNIAGNGNENEIAARLQQRGKGQALRGVFDVDPAQTLHLYVDLKTPGATTLPTVIAHLQPLRSPCNYLTHWNGSHLVRGPVTVHLSGDTPFELMLQRERRDYFYDAPLAELASGRYNTSNSLMATAPLGKTVGKVYWGGMSEQMKETVRAHIREAHERGIGVRYWDTPAWPRRVRNEVWRTLVGLGVDLLNVDDLKAATELEW